jgi:hypothetical protein
LPLEKFDRAGFVPRLGPVRALATAIGTVLLLGVSNASAAEQVTDGGFELGSAAWTFSAGAERCGNCGPFGAAAGDYYAATDSSTSVPIGGSPYAAGQISQPVAIPKVPATLSFQLRQIDFFDDISPMFEISYNGTVLKTFESNVGGPFTLVTIPIPAALASATPQPLSFKLTCFNLGLSGAGSCNRFDIDEVSLTDDPPAPPEQPSLSPPGSNQKAVDTTPPATTIAKTKSPLTVKSKKKKARASVSFSSEAGARFECKLDAGAFGACSSPLALKLKKGRHTFSVRAIDAAGNVDPSPATATINVAVKKPRRSQPG